MSGFYSKVLVNISNISFADEALKKKENDYKELGEHIMDFVCDASDDVTVSGYYPQEGSEKVAIIGKFEPEKIIKYAETFNERIREQAEALIVEATKNIGGKMTPISDIIKSIPRDSVAAMFCRHAFTLIEGDCCSSSTDMIYHDEWFDCEMDERTLADIKANPDHYVVIEILFK